MTAIAELAGCQAGVFARHQVLGLGYSSSAIQRRVASGEWLQVVRGGAVYVHSTAPLTARSWLWAAVLLVGEPCALAVSSAASLWDWNDRDIRPVDLAVPPGRHLSSGPLVRIRRLQVARSALTKRRGLPVTSRARTLADCLRFLPAPEAVRILDRAQQVSRLDLTAVAQHLPAQGRGTAQARRLLAAASGEHSTAERLATALLHQSKIGGWRVNHAIWLEGRRIVIDVAFPAAKVAVEIDGWAFHHEVEAFQRDRQRQNLLVRNGWRVLRFTYRDLIERPDGVVAEIVAVTTQRMD